MDTSAKLSEEIQALKERIVELEAELTAVKEWKLRRIRDDSKAMFSRRARGDDR